VEPAPDPASWWVWFDPLIAHGTAFGDLAERQVQKHLFGEKAMGGQKWRAGRFLVLPVFAPRGFALRLSALRG
jgi:hypothetical protein